MPSIIRHPQAEADMEDIWCYIAKDNPVMAEAFTDKIEAQCRMLAQFPGAGRNRDDLMPGLRSFPIGNYIVFYRPRRNGIEIVRVLHGMRDIDAMF